MTSRRMPLLLTALLVLLALAAMGCYRQMRSAAWAAAMAARDHGECQRLADRLEQLRRRPVQAGSQELETAALVSLIEQSARSAQMPTQSLVRISPEPAARVGETAFKEKPTHVLLRQVTLAQTICFLHALGDGPMGLRIKSVRLASPRELDSPDLWTVEATLTSILYAPRNAGATAE